MLTNGIIKDIEMFDNEYLELGYKPEDGYLLDDIKPSPVYPGENIIHDLTYDKYFKDEDEHAEWLRQNADYEVVQIPYH